MPTPANPMEFRDAVEWARRRGVLPTTLSTRDLESLPAEIRRLAFFSSKVAEAGLLQDMQDNLAELVRGVSDGPGQGLDQATVRLRLKQLLERSGYRPETGTQGSIQDLRTDARLNLIIETQARMAQGYGQWTRTNSDGARLAFPAQELVRLFQRRVPRGFEVHKGQIVERDPQYWQNRWKAAGGEIYEGRMIALKDSPVWAEISRFGTPWPPFDFNSGMGVKNVGRREAVRLGLIEPSSRVSDPRDQYGVDSGLSASAGNFDAALLQRLQDALQEGLNQEFTLNADGILEAV
jgi:hypothetical protein